MMISYVEDTFSTVCAILFLIFINSQLKKMKGNASTSNNSPTKGNLAILDENSGLNLSSMDSDVYCAG